MASIVFNLSPPSLFPASPPTTATPILPSLRPPRRRRRPPLLALALSSSKPITCTTFNGWDDDDDNNNDIDAPGEQNPLFSGFSISAGIDKNHAYIFLLGFFSALAVSRVRFSFMVVIVPISVVVFVAGFAAGAARASGVVGLLNRFLGRNGEFDEKRREIGEFLDDLGDKMRDLKTGLEGAVEKNGLDVGSIKSYVDIVEMVRSVADDTKKSMESLVEEEIGRRKKPSRKRHVDGTDFVQYLGGLVEDCLVGLWPTTKVKDNNASVPVRDDNVVGVGSVKGITVPNERGSKQMRNNILENSEVQRVKRDASEKVEPDNPVIDDDFTFERNAAAVDGEESNYGRDDKFSDDMFSYDDELDSLRGTLHSTTKKGSFEKLVFKQIYKGRTLRNDVYNYAGNGRRMAESIDFVSSESRASSSFERNSEAHDKSYFVSHGKKVTMSKNKHVISSKQAKFNPEDRPILDSEKPRRQMEEEEDDVPSSLKTSADEEFNQNVKEGTKLVKLARECMVRQADEERADSMLYKAARLLSTAVALKPTSLLAMGQLGNTYLLHGELKLKISRELRTLLLRSDGLLNGKGRGVRLNKLDTQALSRENVASVLVDICEECEGLLVEAGRKYRKALAIDGNDVRALYNWGLALSFRAQLIADIGPEAAFDADKVYLAAIDKFSAMMSRNNAHEPEALYRWGVALQHRSHLHPHNSREKIKLLQQAKSLFEDVLCMETDNKLVRESLALCLSDLDYSEDW